MLASFLPVCVCSLSVWCTGEAPFCVDALPIVQRIIRGEHAQAGKRELRKFVLLFFEPLFSVTWRFSAIFVSVVCGIVEDSVTGIRMRNYRDITAKMKHSSFIF